MKKLETILQINNSYQIREETFDGKDYLVAPVVMMTPGVRVGSDGPLFYPSEELSADPGIWNETPVIVNHPTDESGRQISINGAGGHSIVGRVRNSSYEEDKLRAEVWFNKEQLQSNSREVAERLQNQSPLEVSIGVYGRKENEEGEFNGRIYNGVVRDYKPDHLAILPNAQGACSWDDGCGIRFNAKKIDFQNKTKGEPDAMNKGKKEDDNTQSIKQIINELIPHGYKISVFQNQSEVISNEKGFNEISNMIQGKLNTFDNEMSIFFLEEVYTDHFIYRVRSHDSNDVVYFKREYSVSEDGSIVFEEPPTKVTKNVTYEEITTLKRTNFNNNQKQGDDMQKKKVSNSSPCSKIDALIANEATKFTEEDRSWLQNLEEGALDKLTPVEKEEGPSNNGKSEPVNNDSGKAEVGEDQIKQILSQYKDPEEFINNWMPEELKGQMKSGLKTYREKRENLKTGIVNNSKFTAEQLENWPMEDLEVLHNSVMPEQNEEDTDYSVFGNESSGASGDQELSEELKYMFNIGEDKE